MKSIQNYSPNFNGNFIKTGKILKRTPSWDLKKYNASIVQISARDKQDVASIKQASKLWGDGHSIMYGILSSLITDRGSNFYKYFVMTRQNKNFEVLNPKNILGLCQTCKTYDSQEIIYLITNPKYDYKAADREFSGIGKSFLDFVKEQSPNTNIEVFPMFSAVKFYKKYGFKQKENSCSLILKNKS